MCKLLVIVALLLPTTARADAGERWDGVTILEQTGAGAALGIGGGMLLMYAGARLASDSKEDWSGQLTGAMVGGTIGGLGGILVGVKLTGDWRGGNGGWLATAGGTVTGAFLTFATAHAYVDKVPPYIVVAFATITLLAPPIVAYHLSSDENPDVEKRVTVPLLLGTF